MHGFHKSQSKRADVLYEVLILKLPSPLHYPSPNNLECPCPKITLWNFTSQQELHCILPPTFSLASLPHPHHPCLLCVVEVTQLHYIHNWTNLVSTSIFLYAHYLFNYNLLFSFDPFFPYAPLKHRFFKPSFSKWLFRLKCWLSNQFW